MWVKVAAITKVAGRYIVNCASSLSHTEDGFVVSLWIESGGERGGGRFECPEPYDFRI